MIRDSIGPDFLYRILGTSAQQETEHLATRFRLLAENAIDGDTWWSYDAEKFGAGSGVALMRNDELVGYLMLESEH